MRVSPAAALLLLATVALAAAPDELLTLPILDDDGGGGGGHGVEAAADGVATPRSVSEDASAPRSSDFDTDFEHSPEEDAAASAPKVGASGGAEPLGAAPSPTPHPPLLPPPPARPRLPDPRRAACRDADASHRLLASIEVSAGVLTPPFHPLVTEYSLRLPSRAAKDAADAANAPFIPAVWSTTEEEEDAGNKEARHWPAAAVRVFPVPCDPAAAGPQYTSPPTFSAAELNIRRCVAPVTTL